MDSKAVDAVLRELLWAELKRQGFTRRTGRTAWRDQGDAGPTERTDCLGRADRKTCREQPRLVQRLGEVEEARLRGLITPEEYEAARAQILRAV
jgi:hypothetical protein